MLYHTARRSITCPLACQAGVFVVVLHLLLVPNHHVGTLLLSAAGLLGAVWSGIAAAGILVSRALETHMWLAAVYCTYWDTSAAALLQGGLLVPVHSDAHVRQMNACSENVLIACSAAPRALTAMPSTLQASTAATTGIISA
jgi:hypothetical protein